MNRGDIVLVNLPAPDSGSGYEEMGNRPALVVHNDATSGVLSVVMIVPFTSKMGAQRFPHAVVVQPSAANGLSCAQGRALHHTVLCSGVLWRCGSGATVLCRGHICAAQDAQLWRRRPATGGPRHSLPSRPAPGRARRQAARRSSANALPLTRYRAPWTSGRPG
jgi:mRNA-degrading endonuclease toxin of MazEF toxin-antitoxin module